MTWSWCLDHLTGHGPRPQPLQLVVVAKARYPSAVTVCNTHVPHGYWPSSTLERERERERLSMLQASSIGVFSVFLVGGWGFGGPAGGGLGWGRPGWGVVVAG